MFYEFVASDAGDNVAAGIALRIRGPMESRGRISTAASKSAAALGMP